MDEIRSQLKTMSRQFAYYMKQRTATKNNLISLLEQTFPGTNDFFDSPARSNGSQKWVDFVYTYWHIERIRDMSLPAFTEHYRKYCSRKGYNFQSGKPAKIYDAIRNITPVLPKDEITKFIVRQAVEHVNTASVAVEGLRTSMNETASQLPEHPAVLALKGVGTSLGPQLMAEIGDITRFTHKGSLTAFAGVDPGKNKPGSYTQKSVHTFKRGTATLRKTLFQVMDCLIKTIPADDPVYAFMDKKRAQGKPYYAYMTAGTNKFLCVYYGRIKEHLASLNKTEND